MWQNDIIFATATTDALSVYNCGYECVKKTVRKYLPHSLLPTTDRLC